MTQEKKPAEREQVTLRLPRELMKELNAIAKQTGLTVSALLIVAIWRSVLKLKDLPL